MSKSKHTPTPCRITRETRNALLEAISNATVDARTGAAFVSVDTRVLDTLVRIARAVAETIRMTDPESEDFADSGADCLQHLLEACDAIVA